MSRRSVLNFGLPGAILLALLPSIACSRGSGLPAPESKEYRDLVTAFYVGLAGLQTGEDVRAKEKLTLATQIAPGEPAAWANLGLLAVRQQEYDKAFEHVDRARSLAPEVSHIHALLGMIDSRRGNLPAAISHITKAVELDPRNLKALYALSQERERESGAGSDQAAQQLLTRILAIDPNNPAVLIEATRLAARRGDRETLRRMVETLAAVSTDWPIEAQQQFAELKQAAAGDNPALAATQSAFLKNVLLRAPAYRRGLNAVRTPPEFVGDPFLQFIKLPSPRPLPAPPDASLTFTSQPIAGAPAGRWSRITSLVLDEAAKPMIALASSTSVVLVGGARFDFKGLPADAPPIDVLPLDFNYDFKMDLLLSGGFGLRFYRQEKNGAFTDVTSITALNASLLKDAIKAGVAASRAIDVDLDGDLDVLLSAIPNGSPVQPLVLRNNGDGTFKPLEPFRISYGASEGGPAREVTQGSLAAADVDGDGDPDLAMASRADCATPCGLRMRIFINERLGQYREIVIDHGSDQRGWIVDLGAAEIDGDGVMDFVALRADGKILRLYEAGEGKGWALAEVAALPGAEADGRRQLFISDLDNNGALDLIIGGWAPGSALDVLLNHGQGQFNPLAVPSGASGAMAIDLNDDGRLDLAGLNGDGGAVMLLNRGTKSYRAQTIRTRAARATGDQRINSFGLGGEIEIRSGLLTQKQVIAQPLAHFGMGENTQTDVARIVWPNGAVQAEFELKAGESILAEQRLKGSCPALFAWDGQRMSFVKDCSPWNPALGLRINAQEVAEVDQTEEWFRIRGDQLAPRDGFYDLRVTAELWETFYIDHYSLLVVDHPPGAQIFTDERFTIPQPAPRIYVTATPQPFASAIDDRGADVSSLVDGLDQRYLDTFGRGQYQGVTRDHWVELEIGENAPRDRPLYLIGHGWLHPTDATINVALGQQSGIRPQGLSLEAPDGRGGWATARAGLGFLSGKLKTMIIDLDRVFRPGAPRRLRLRTNMEIYWDQLQWAIKAHSDQIRVQRLNASEAELRYRGFSSSRQADASSPELPDYEQIAGTAPRWRDLEGYYTRFGDVRELLAQTDDRLLIMNAGDELRLRFAAPKPPPPGWERDFVMVGDGWTKDGDYNCAHAATVLPLPYHGIRGYNHASTLLEDNPAFRRHPRDWQKYHTRYVTPDPFTGALRPPPALPLRQ
jgi:tetratricopeptide (TPR) repeat protein